MEDYVPLSKRPIAELRNRAAEYRRMAETARLTDTAPSLLRLADLYDDLADRRRSTGSEVRSWRELMRRAAANESDA